MKVLAGTKGLDKRQEYRLYKPLEPRSMKEVDDGVVITVTQWLIYEDLNHNGEQVTILAIYDEIAGVTYQTNSATFQREFNDIVSLLTDENLQIVKKSGKTRSDRPFVTCVLA